MPVVPGDSGSPVWYWDKFDLAIAGMIVLQVGEEARAIPAGKLYEYVQSVLQDASLIERLNNWRNQ